MLLPDVNFFGGYARLNFVQLFAGVLNAVMVFVSLLLGGEQLHSSSLFSIASSALTSVLVWWLPSQPQVIHTAEA